jgi:transcriptional regulator GlxA family with amidase domain
VRTSSRTLAVLLFDEVELWDVAAVMQVASLAGRHWNWRPFRLLPTAERAGLIDTRSQLRLEATSSLESCPEPEILLVPGGYGARRAAQNPVITRWCAERWPKLQLTLAIGTGALVLGAAGVLDGEDVAVASDNRDWISAELAQARCVESSNVVSSASGKLLSVGSGAQGIELGLALVERCLGARLTRTLRASLFPETTTRIDVAAMTLELPGKPR